MNEDLQRAAPHQGVGARLALTYDYELWRPLQAAFAELIEERALDHVHSLYWDTEVDTLDALLGYAVRSGRYEWGSTAVLDLEAGHGCHALVSVDDGVFRVYLAAHDRERLAAGEAFLRDRVPKVDRDVDRRISVTFWSGSCGTDWSSRTIAVPTWDDVSRNYPAPVAAQLEEAMCFKPSASGQLMLWHGAPGTGKTYAIRALGWEWRQWCDVHYIVDPELFFGQSGYMLDVLLHYGPGDEDGRWRLLVLEDTGELLASDAKAQSGQGLSRLLNLVDGIVGQGLRVLVLVTTNDDLRQLHPAVTRPGRCASRIEFVGFTGGEAAAWLEQNGVQGDGRAGTLARLFAAADGREEPTPPRVGFVQ